MSSADDSQPTPHQSARAAGYRIGPAPIAEPEEVTDVSVQASRTSLADDLTTATVAPATTTPTASAADTARDEPDVRVQFGPDRLYRRLRDGPMSNLGKSVRELNWWPTDRCRRLRNRLCPPFRVQENAVNVRESELVNAFLVGQLL